MDDYRLVKQEITDTENALFWNNLHPDGGLCPRCYTCIAFKCLNKLRLLANHIELIKVEVSRLHSHSFTDCEVMCCAVLCKGKSGR